MMINLNSLMKKIKVPNTNMSIHRQFFLTIKYISLHNSNLIFIIPGSVRRRSSVHPSDILAVTGVLMKEGTLGASKGRNGSITSNESIDSLTKANTEANMFSGRRRTIKDMKKNYTKNKGN